MTFEQRVSFRVSLTVDFSDSQNSVHFDYYPVTHVTWISPRYGPKDGGTLVKVHGQNFRNYLETSCDFGSVSVPAVYFNDTYLECKSPFSDVVVKNIGFSVSMNRQQQSDD